jgi:hypothetical protein
MQKSLTFIVIVGFLATCGRIDSKMKKDKSESYVEQEKYPVLDSFILGEVEKAIFHAKEEYDYQGKVTIVNSYRTGRFVEEAVDVKKGVKFYTRVSLSQRGDTLYVKTLLKRPVDSTDKKSEYVLPVYSVALDQMIEFDLLKSASN